MTYTFKTETVFVNIKGCWFRKYSENTNDVIVKQKS